MFQSLLNQPPLFVVILGQLAAIFLPCNAVFSDLSSGQVTITQCLKNCSESFAKIPTSRKSCYEKCLKREEILRSYGKQQVKPSFRRFKRDGSSKANSSSFSDRCFDWESRNCTHGVNDGPLIVKGVNRTILHLNGTDRCYVNLTWEPLQNTSGSWKGYHVWYRFRSISDSVVTDCSDIGKEVNHYILTNSLHGFIDYTNLKVLITSLPFGNGTQPGCESFKHYQVLCSESERATRPDGSTQSSPPDGSTQSLPPDNKINVTAATSISGVAVVVVALISIWCCRRSKTCKSTGKQCHIARHGYEDQPLIFEYDAFIIYSSKDQEWVKGTLLSTLEDKHGLKCCIHYRNFKAGALYRENMVDSVYKSRKTIAVLSTNFFTSGFCETEFEYALRRLAERRDDSLIVIKLGHFDTDKLPMELKQRSYIDCPKSVEKETWESNLVNSLKVSC